jgi:pimeloyl-ACP methyl ester carboxylesterase
MECKIKNILVNYEIIGEGKPIVMIHGYYADNRVMAGCMEPIFSAKDGYKRIYIDLPGMGKSESPEWITNSDTMLDIVIEFIEKIIQFCQQNYKNDIIKWASPFKGDRIPLDKPPLIKVFSDAHVAGKLFFSYLYPPATPLR